MMINVLLIKTVSKVQWEYLFLGLMSMAIGLFGLLTWKSKKIMKDDPGAYNLRKILAAIVFIPTAIYGLFEFIKSFLN